MSFVQAFDFQREEWEEGFPLPLGVPNPQDPYFLFNFKFIEWDEQVCFVHGFHCEITIWVLREKEENKSWEKVIKLELEKEVFEPHGFGLNMPVAMPHGFGLKMPVAMHGESLLTGVRGAILLYNVKSGQRTKLVWDHGYMDDLLPFRSTVFAPVKWA
ncbi:hypothetical protein AMTRI_Chr11g156990 [Amborella trichopoda]|uniref:Uncharacterized protein n=1 Tax=Amborella trichopoda TaxID=13333 RepID=W1NLN5_AMBTC|nr:hypothetical protein AMTR_s00202p00032320 [Amborella trichopoda]